MRKFVGKILCLVCLAACAHAAAADLLTLSNGDHLAGTVVRGDANGVTFHSPALGDLHVSWKQVQWLTAGGQFIMVTNDKTWRGNFTAQGDDITLLPAGGTPVALRANALIEVVKPAVYQSQLEAARLPPWRGWQGAIAAGFSLVSATQSANSYTVSLAFHRSGGIRLAKAPQSNTQVSFQGDYGSVSQPRSPTVLTSIYTAAFEQDQNISPRFFMLGRAQVDHNLAQGLQLQQSYGGGLGWKPIQNATAQMDLKAGLHFTHQAFISAPAARFLAADLTENYRRLLPSAMVWTEKLEVSPAVTKGNAYQASADTALVVPVYKNLSFNIRLSDSYLGNPQPGFRHNSLQFSSGLQITVR